MARVVARGVRCELVTPKPDNNTVPGKQWDAVPGVLKFKTGEAENDKILLQPRLCTLRSYAEDPFGVVKTARKDGGDDDGPIVSPFFETLSDYIESSKKSYDFEIINGRLAMIVFAAIVGTEFVTGNSVFRKMDLQGIEEAAGVCVGAVTCAAICDSL